MKPGDMVSIRKDFVAIHVVSDELESQGGTDDFTTFTFGQLSEMRSFRRGDTGIVVGFNDSRPNRVKILYNSGLWWGNAGSFTVVK